MSQKTLRGLLIAVSLLLVCVLIIQCLFWIGVIGKRRKARPLFLRRLPPGKAACLGMVIRLSRSLCSVATTSVRP